MLVHKTRIRIMKSTQSWFMHLILFLLFIPTSQHVIMAQSNSSDTSIKTLNFRIINYFNNKCARCHGPRGSFYGGDFAQDMTTDSLRNIIHEMTVGPGGMALSGDSLSALVAYHRSLSSNSPFIAVTRLHKNTLQGEISGADTLYMLTGKDTIQAYIQDGLWSVQVQNHEYFLNARLCTSIEKITLCLDLGNSAYSRFD